ncbi:MAG: phosphatase PAP2 family protein, partial [Oscillospiraceae bacterium]
MENQIISSIQSIANPVLDFMFKLITIIGEQYVLIIIAAYLYWCKNKNQGLNYIFIVVFSAVSNTVFKGIIKRSRPEFDGLRKLRESTASGYSFPSGHTQNITTLFMGFFLIFKEKIKKQGVFLSIATILIFLVGFSRIYLGAHYPTDVIFAIIFGLIFSFVPNFLFNKFKNKNKLFLSIIGILLPVAIYFYFIPITDSLQNMADFFKLYGLFCAITLGNFLENKYINFSTENITLKNKIFRIITGCLVLGLLYLCVKLIFPNAYIFSFLKYFIVG